MDVPFEHLIILIINQYNKVFFMLINEVLKEFIFDCERYSNKRIRLEHSYEGNC